MASINKLSVRGVRSFSPEDAEQVLEFYTPLTVIVGENGCGKTTIIESLKFAVCGSLPPGKTAGQAFVHDPRSIGSAVVKANLKLRFTNGAGKPMVIVRSMEVQQQKKKLAFKQLDGTLRATDRNGQRVAMSHKCSELDRQIPLLLGVSKAILENVVFCHQEDASWPLQEGLVLKKKFDDIFDSTRYSKALEVFAKSKKEYVLKAKDHKADVAELRSHRHAAQGFRKEAQEHAEQLDELEDHLASGRQALEENEEEQQRLDDLLTKADDAYKKIESKRQDMLLERKALQMRRSMLQENLIDRFDERELNEQLKTFDTQKESHWDKKRDLEKKVRACKREIDAIRNEQTELQSEVGRLQAGKESHMKSLRKRYEKMCEIGEAYGLEAMLTPLTQNSQLGSATSGRLSSTQDTVYSRHHHRTQGDESPGRGVPEHGDGEAIIDIPQDDIKQYFRAVENKKEELHGQLSTQKSKIREQEDELNNDLSDLKGKVKSIESKKKELYAEETKTRKELEQIRKQSQRGQKFRKSNLEDAKKNAIEAAKNRDESNSDPRRKDIPIEIASTTNKIDDLKMKIQNDTVVQQDLRRTFETQSAIEQLKGQCQTEIEELKEKISEYRFQFQAYKISPPPQDLPGTDIDKRGEQLKKVMETVSDEINDKFEERDRELTKTRDTIRRIEAIVSEKSALYNHDIQSIRSKQQRMSGLKPSIERTRQVVEELRSFEARDEGISTPVAITENRPEELLSYLTERIGDIEGQSIEGISPEMIKRVMKKLFNLAYPEDKERNYFCPCCERDLIDEIDVKRFSKAMKRLSGASSLLIQVDERTKVAETKYKEWQHVVKDSVNDILEFRRLENDLGELEKNASTLDSTLRDRNTELEKVKSLIESIEGEVKDFRELYDASKIWVEASLRISLQRDQVNQKESDFRLMNSDREGRDLKQVEADLLDSNRKKDDFNEKITKLNMELANVNDRVLNFSKTATRLEDQLKKMESKYEEQMKFEERTTELNKNFAERKHEQDKLSEQIAPLNQRIEAKESQRNRARKLAEEEEKRITSTFNAFNNDVTALQNIVDSIEDYEKSNSQDDVQRIEAEREILVKKGKMKNEEIERMEPDLNRLAKIVDDQELQRKNLEDNIKVIQSQQKMKEIEHEMAEIEEGNEGTEDRDSLEEDQERLRRRNDELIARKARLEGKRGVIIDTARGLKRKLSQSEYKDVEEDFRIASIKQDTTEMAVKDIEKYHSALDQALQRYHSIKITQINAIIRDLWTLTYKGEDIRSIEIVSGKDAGGRSSRSYNYRVVMSKGGGVMMDMRGRCSAGQRVLASIVIRLALAETFCVKFGCISLDEPTVNLDDKNKKGLALALAQIIASRAQQSNFQLVLITHDEDFVMMMKSELSTQPNVSMPEKYFQIKREEGQDGKYYSKIDAIDWEELL